MIDTLNFSKLGGLVPAIIQDANTLQVLMVGFMNREAVEKTLRERKAIFWSRTKQRLWQKGESSGNTLHVVSVAVDCDSDALLIKAVPDGPVCHDGTFTCFGENEAGTSQSIFDRLESIVESRRQQLPDASHTANLFREGIGRIAQKVGEEAIEVCIAAVQNNVDAVREESADLLYHLIVLLKDRGLSLESVAETLKSRMKETKPSS